jgi:hypothetical protein
VARAILLVASVVWLVAGIVGVGLAAWGTEAIEASLPPLAIDTEALRGAILAVGVSLIGLAGVHAVVLLGLRARARWALTGGVLLAGLLTMLCLALGAAAITSAVAEPAQAVPLMAAGAAMGLMTGAYGALTVGLIGDVRDRARS